MPLPATPCILPMAKRPFAKVQMQQTQGLSGSIWHPGIYEIGHSDENFAFDNEKKQHQVYINACAIQNSLVTNGDFLEFIDKGGYDDFNHWHDEGWHWRKTNAIEHPQYWQKKRRQMVSVYACRFA
jgi:formylglycine-generating enzyme required for sulfatase activity